MRRRFLCPGEIEDMQHDQVEEQGNGGCPSMVLKDIARVTKSHEWGEIGGQKDQSRIPQEQQPLLKGARGDHAVRRYLIGYGCLKNMMKGKE
jgi:hypothetical protein